MDYKQSIQYLNSFLNLETLAFHPDNRVWNLKRMRLLLDLFDHPERDCLPILIAGTKGKGSAGFFLSSILEAAGIPAGFYNSPHLTDPRERIRVGSKMVSQAVWAREVTRIHEKLSVFSPLPGMGQFTYFEICTLLAAMIFKRLKLRVGVFEVGLGGRLDATNALEPRLSLLMPIHFDHEEFLGNQLAEIAGEKAAIIRPYADVVVSRQLPEAMRVILNKVKTEKARAHFIKKPYPGKTGLIGEYQNWNAASAVRMAGILNDQYAFQISGKAIQKGLKAADWPGRFEKIGSKPDFILDVAHNPASAEALTRTLKKEYPKKKATLIFAVSKDKKAQKMLSVFGGFFKRIIVTRFSNPRARDIGELLAMAKGHFMEIRAVANSREAVRLAYELTDSRDLIVACGSFYLAGEIQTLMKRRKK